MIQTHGRGKEFLPFEQQEMLYPSLVFLILRDPRSPPPCLSQQETLWNPMGPEISRYWQLMFSDNCYRHLGYKIQTNSKLCVLCYCNSVLSCWTYRKGEKQGDKFLYWNLNQHWWPSNTLVSPPLLWNNGRVWTCIIKAKYYSAN